MQMSTGDDDRRGDGTMDLATLSAEACSKPSSAPGLGLDGHCADSNCEDDDDGSGCVCHNDGPR